MKKPKPTIKRALSSFLLRLTAIDEQHNEHWFYYNENHGIIERLKFCDVRLQPLSFTKRFAFRIVFLSCVSLRLFDHTLWTGRDKCLQGRDHCSTPFIILRPN